MHAFLILKVGPHKKPVWETGPTALVMDRVKKLIKTVLQRGTAININPPEGR